MATVTHVLNIDLPLGLKVATGKTGKASHSHTTNY